MAAKLKRLAAAVIAVCVAAGSIITSLPAAASGIRNATYEQKKKLLEDIGILKLNIEDPSAVLSRGQFADMAMRSYFRELPEYEKAVTFYDVIPNYEFKDAVEAGYNSGIIRGVGENTFGADDNITVKEAVIIMLRILNYERYIEGFGSIDDKFADIAADIKLTKNINVTKQELCLEDAVQLLYNASDIAPLKLVTGKNNNLTYEADRSTTLISERLGIEQAGGILTANGFTDLEGGEALGENMVRIDGIAYSAGETAADEFIGYNVLIYYDEDSNTILHIEDDESEVKFVDIADDSSYSNGVLKYWKNGSGGGKTVNIGVDSIIVYNDNLVRNGQYDDSLFDIDIGTITVIEESLDGHTVVLIRSYRDVVVDRCIREDDSTIIVDRFDSQGSIVVPDDAMFDIKDENGARLEADKIPAEAVVSAAVSADGKSGRLIVNTTANKLTQAYVLSAGESDVLIKTYTEAKHTYEENEFEYTGAFEKKNAAEKIVAPGSEYTAYIDAFGFMAYMSLDADMSDFYVYIINAYADDTDPEERVYIRVFRDDGKVTQYRLAENVTIDAVNCKKKKNEEILGLIDIQNEKKSRLAYVSLTFGGEVRSIDTCLEETDAREGDYTLYKTEREAEDTLYKIDGGPATYASSIPNRLRYMSETKAFDTGILLSSSTKILAIPRDSEDTDRFKVLTTASFLNDRCYNVKAYGRDDDAIAPDILLYFYYSRYSPDIGTAEVTGTSSYANLPFERTYDADPGIVTKCAPEVNEETDEVETVVRITNLRSSSESVFYTCDEALTAGISEGQLVRYFAVGGSLCYLEKLYSIPDREFNSDIRTIKWVNGATSVPSYFITHDGTYLADSYSASETENPVFGVARGVIMKNNKTHIAYVTYDNYQSGKTDESNWKKYLCSAVKVYKYNEHGNRLEIKSFDDLISYDESSLLNSEVVIVTKNKSVIGIITY